MSITIGRRRYLTNFEHHRLPHLFTDTLVLGSGLAGLVAALEAAEEGEVLIVTKHEARESATLYAQGGIAAALAPSDSPAEHARDTLRVGCDLADANVVAEVAGEAAAAVHLLRDYGTRFDLDGAELTFGREGGHTQPRIIHALATPPAARSCAPCSNASASTRASASSKTASPSTCLRATARCRASSPITRSTATRCSGPPPPYSPLAAPAASIAKRRTPQSPPATASPWPSAPAPCCATWRCSSFIPPLCTWPAPPAPWFLRPCAARARYW